MKESGSDNNLSQWWRKKVSKWRVKAKLLLVPKEAKRPQALIKPDVTGTIADSQEIFEDIMFFVHKFGVCASSALCKVSDFHIAQFLSKYGEGSTDIQPKIPDFSGLLADLKSSKAILNYYLSPEVEKLVINQPERLPFLQEIKSLALSSFGRLNSAITNTSDDPELNRPLRLIVDELLLYINILLSGVRKILGATSVATQNKDYVSFYELEELAHENITSEIERLCQERIGLFWLSPDYNKVLVVVKNGSSFGIYKDTPVVPRHPHRKVWDKVKGKESLAPYSPKRFNSLPRGRVEYDGRGNFIISLGTRITQEGIDQIVDAFGLSDRNWELRKNSFWDSK
jgi:hypothetical protein